MTDTAAMSVETLLAHAFAIEREAEARYSELADQMEVHNNQELAELFRKLAVIEGKHAAKIQERADGMDLPYISPLSFRWPGVEPPENVELAEAHYMMTAHHALKMALAGEQRAAAYFQGIADGAQGEAKAIADELAEEEHEHVRLVEEWLKKYPEPESDWDEDLDPPMLQE